VPNIGAMEQRQPLPTRRQLIAGAAAACIAPWIRHANAAGGEILLGQFAAETGPAAELGKRMQLGMDACFRAANAAGGVAGRPIRLVSRDDGYEPDRALAAAKALIEEDKVFALIGSVGTPTNLAALPAITKAGIPLVGPFTGAQALREPLNRNLFHVRASYFDETERIVQHLTTIGVTRISVFYQDDAYGKAGLEGVVRALARRKMKPTLTTTVERNTVDVAKAAAETVKEQPEAVVQISAYKSCAALIKQTRAKGYAGMFFNVSFVGSQALADELGDEGVGVAVSQVVPFPYVPLTAVVREYQQRMQEAGHKDFDFTSMEGFLAAKVMLEGLRRAGHNLTRETLVAELERLRQWDMGGFTVSYSPTNHEGSHYTDLTIIGKGGRFVH
jgi:ABC-type branched-subunit amino acid transport system substrate-binding protein